MHYDITGLRRAGKSCLLYQHIQDLVDKGQSMEEMLLVKKLVESLMQPVGIKRLHDLLRADGTAVVRSTVQLYLSYLEEAFLTFHLENFTSSVAERASMRKYYFRDNGLLNLFLIDNKAKLLENLVAITLFKRYGEGLCYYRQNIEVDFYVPEINMALQASYVMDNTTIAREVKALVALHKFRPLDRAVIVTYEEEDRIVEDGLTIEVVPLAEWLLEQDRS